MAAPLRTLGSSRATRAALACALSLVLWPTAAHAASTTIVLNEVEVDTPGTEPATEWVELRNVSAGTIVLTNWTLTDNTASDTIPSLSLGPGETVVLATDSAEFFAAHPGFTGSCVVSITGSIGGGLGNTGDRVILKDASDVVVDSMSYGSDTTVFNPSLALGTANTTETYQRTSAVDSDTASDWTFAPETPACGPPNQAPSLGAIGGRSVAEGAQLAFTLSSTDPDADPVSFSAANLPAGATFGAGAFSWTPGFDQAGSYPGVRFEVGDGRGGADSEEITITVADTNRAPVLGVVGNRTVDEGRGLTFALSASDPDGDQVTFSASGLPAGATFGAGAFSWTPAFNQAGTHAGVELRVDDGRGGTDSESVAIDVRNVLRPTTATLTVEKTRTKLKPAGRVRGGTPGVQLKVVLLRKRGGRFRRLATRRPRLNGRSRYAASFTRPAAGRCRITVAYPGDGETAKTSRRATFRC